jgi:hypothetical protein
MTKNEQVSTDLRKARPSIEQARRSVLSDGDRARLIEVIDADAEIALRERWWDR